MATDLELLIRDKYDGDVAQVTDEDRERLAAGEPLAYVIGWIPFLGIQVHLDSKPLIPRPETEWWTELLLMHLRERFGNEPFSFLDLCAGSGAIGLAVLRAFPEAAVTFAELIPEHCELIEKNIRENDLLRKSTMIYHSDVFEGIPMDARFDCIATNPPYIPEGRALDTSVTRFEPAEALFAGSDGLSIIRRIAAGARERLSPGGEIWMECDITNIEAASVLLLGSAAYRTDIRSDLYGRPRLVVAYF
ncbi:MAG: HemK/PrmC family methyltransferase [Patescibacteria group bacterium]